MNTMDAMDAMDAMDKTAILFTGKIYPIELDNLIEQTKTIKNKFASIWCNEDPTYILRLVSNNFTIIKSNVEQQVMFIPQFVPIVNGLKFIKEQGFEFVLRTRFDVLSTDYIKYLELMRGLYTDKITVISGINHGSTLLYFLDIIVFGNINAMCLFYTLQPIEDGRCPEKFLMENYSNKTNLTKDDIMEVFNFSLTSCIDNHMEFIWYRPGNWHEPSDCESHIMTDYAMRVINAYCKNALIWI